jgi:primosomal protein N' (replication factor Y) (superfamily II helicase)
VDPIVIKIAVARPLDRLYTYTVPAEKKEFIVIGNWVKVSFGKSSCYGFIVEILGALTEVELDFPKKNLKSIQEIGPIDQALPEKVLELCQWTSKYYCTALGEVCMTASPLATLGLKNTKKEAKDLKEKEFVPPVFKKLNEEQTISAAFILSKRENEKAPVVLLKGVTGSGKTEVYFEVARKILAEGKSVLFLVPEIALTNQLVRRIEEGLGEQVVEWHSAMAAGKRRDQTAALRRGQLRVVVGARSGVFAPLPNLGVIIVDEEHDPTYKQEDRVRYHARDLAIVRGKMEQATVILGSATPSLESIQRCEDHKYHFSEIKFRFNQQDLPAIDLVSLREELCVEGIQARLAERTLEEIKSTLSRGEQVMLFLNRRGFAQFLLCEDCGEVEECPNCSISLTYHFQKKLLKCHVCGYEHGVPEACGKCNSIHLKMMGAGTESLEEELPKILPDARILRLDRDTVTSATRLETILKDFREKKADILVGTQMLVKGHDFPEVTLVVVLFADGLFRFPDFRANERSYQTLLQVAGRSGRGEKKGKVLIQTFEPEHPIFQVLKGEISEEDFLAEEKSMREALLYPPFSRLARLRIEASSKEVAMKRSSELKDIFESLHRSNSDDLFEALGPSEAFLEKAKGIFRWDILLKSASIGKLHSFIGVAKKWAETNEVSLLVDVDPYGVG